MGGWSLGVDSSNFISVSKNTGGARTKMATSLASLCTKWVCLLLVAKVTSRQDRYNLDGVDIEWASSVTAAQFTSIISAVKSALGDKNVSVSLASDFWSLTGLNKGDMEDHRSPSRGILTPHSGTQVQHRICKPLYALVAHQFYNIKCQ